MNINKTPKRKEEHSLANIHPKKIIIEVIKSEGRNKKPSPSDEQNFCQSKKLIVT